MIIDPLEVIDAIGKEVLSAIAYLLLYLFLIPLFWQLKRTIAKTDFWIFIQFWRYRYRLFEHKIFNQITEIYSIKYQFNILNVGKKLCFGELLSTEIEAINGYLFDFLRHVYRKNFREFLAQGYHSIDKKFLIDKLLTDYRGFINLSHEYLLNKYINSIDIDSVDIIRFAKKNKDYPIDEISEVVIKNKIRNQKLTIILNLYEKIMLPYRNQIIENLEEFYSSEKLSYEVIEDIFNNCYSPVLRNIKKTIPVAINMINGELKDISWKGHLLV